MSKYLNPPDDIVTPVLIFGGLQRYVPDEFSALLDLSKLPKSALFLKDNGEKLIQKYIDALSNKFRMYGTAHELAENLKAYRDFPESHRFFGYDKFPYFNSATIYRSLNGLEFISIQDILTILQNMAFQIFPGSHSYEMRLSIMTPLLATESKFTNLSQFVRFDQSVFDKIEIEVREDAKVFVIEKEEISKLEKDFSAGNLHDFFTKFPRFDSRKSTQNDKGAESVKEYYKELKPSNKVEEMVMFLYIMKSVSKVLETRPRLFTVSPTVRLFEDGDNKFVMKAELFRILDQKSGEFKEEKHFFTTISMEEFMKVYGKRLGCVEFIPTRIPRTHHRTVPVKGVQPGEFGLLAVDALLDVLKSSIHGPKLFQRNKFVSDMIIDLIREISEPIFKTDKKTPYFIREGVCQMLVTNLKELKQKAEAVFPAKEVRNAKVDGFTLKNLKSELARLNLIVTFPEIQNYAEVVYEHVNRVKKERFLRTCDLFDAIENCQLICLFERLPNLKTFLHSQGGCGRVIGLKCQLCTDQQKTLEIQKARKLEAADSTVTFIEPQAPNTIELCSESKEMKEKLSKLEQELPQKIQENQELHMANIKFTAENETKSGKIEKLMNKLSIGSPSKPSVTVVEKPITCIICQGGIEGRMTIDCPLCSTRFHKKYAFQYGQHQTKCPACKGEDVKYIC